MNDEAQSSFTGSDAPRGSGAINEELRYAHQLATALWDKHYRDDAPHWQPLPDLIGVLTQIDNMTTGLARAPQGQSERGVTDAMVQEACEVYGEVYRDDDKDMGDAMRAALVAVLPSHGGDSEAADEDSYERGFKAGFEVASAAPQPLHPGDGAPRGTCTTPIEALRNCGCPSDRRGTVGECQDRGTCGCSLPSTEGK